MSEWVEKFSNSRQRVYYYNTKTGESVWDKPEGFSSSDAGNAPSQVRARHLLVKHKDSRRPSSWKSPTITRSKEEARSILQGYQQQISNGSTTLDALAKTESDCSSAKNGGDLGFFGRGAMQKPFEEATFALQVGEISDIIETDSGLHIIERTG